MEFKDKQKTLFKRLKELRQRATKSELVIKSKLDRLGIKYIFQKGFIEGGNYCIVDFYLPNPYKLCIEVDGKYHETEKQQLRDKNRDAYLTQYRHFKMLRITNEDAFKITPDALMQLILKAR